MEVIDDAYGYDAYKHRRARIVPSAVAIIVLGASLGSFATLLPPIRSDDAQAIAASLDKFVSTATQNAIKGHISQSYAIVSLVVIASVAIGVAMLAYARKNRQAYMDAYPRIKNFYTDAQRANARRERNVRVGFGAAIVVVSLLVCAAVAAIQMAMGIDPWSKHALAISVGVGLFCAAPGLWLVVHGVMLGRRTDIFAYNYEALTRVSRYQIAATQTGEQRRIMLGEKSISATVTIVSRVCMALGALSSVALYLLPSFKSPWYWVPLTVSLALWYAIYKLGGWRAKRRYEHQDEAGKPERENGS